MELYHNPRCSKSRETLQLLQENGIEPDLILYMKEPPTPKQLKEVLKKLGISPTDLLRKNEKVWKEEFAGKELTDEEITLAMIEHPQLIERPILINESQAAVGRPPEKVLEII